MRNAPCRNSLADKPQRSLGIRSRLGKMINSVKKFSLQSLLGPPPDKQMENRSNVQFEYTATTTRHNQNDESSTDDSLIVNWYRMDYYKEDVVRPYPQSQNTLENDVFDREGEEKVEEEEEAEEDIRQFQGRLATADVEKNIAKRRVGKPCPRRESKKRSESRRSRTNSTKRRSRSSFETQNSNAQIHLRRKAIVPKCVLEKHSQKIDTEIASLIISTLEGKKNMEITSGFYSTKGDGRPHKIRNKTCSREETGGRQTVVRMKHQGVENVKRRNSERSQEDGQPRDKNIEIDDTQTIKEWKGQSKGKNLKTKEEVKRKERKEKSKGDEMKTNEERKKEKKEHSNSEEMMTKEEEKIRERSGRSNGDEMKMKEEKRRERRRQSKGEEMKMKDVKRKEGKEVSKDEEMEMKEDKRRERKEQTTSAEKERYLFNEMNAFVRATRNLLFGEQIKTLTNALSRRRLPVVSPSRNTQNASNDGALGREFSNNQLAASRTKNDGALGREFSNNQSAASRTKNDGVLGREFSNNQSAASRSKNDGATLSLASACTSELSELIGKEEQNAAILKQGAVRMSTSSSNILIQTPPYFPYTHSLTYRMMESMGSLHDPPVVRMNCEPFLFHSVYYQIADSPPTGFPAYNKRCFLLLTCQGLCVYMDYAKMLEKLCSYHSLGKCEIEANDPCFVTHVTERSKLGDIEVIPPACLAIRRNSFEVLSSLMTRGWCPHEPLRTFYRRPFECTEGQYDDSIDYYLRVMNERSDLSITSFITALVKAKETNFNVNYYKIMERNISDSGKIDDSVSIPRRLLHYLVRQKHLNHAFDILMAVTIFIDASLFDGSETYNSVIDISSQRRENLLEGVKKSDPEACRTYDQDCCLALCLSIIDKLSPFINRKKDSLLQKIIMTTTRILLQTRWLKTFYSSSAQETATYFSDMGEDPFISESTVLNVRTGIESILRRQSFDSDVNHKETAKFVNFIAEQEKAKSGGRRTSTRRSSTRRQRRSMEAE